MDDREAGEPAALRALGLTGAGRTAYLRLVRTGADEQLGEAVQEELLAVGLVTVREGRVEAVPPRTALGLLASRRQEEAAHLVDAAERLGAEFERRLHDGSTVVEVFDDPATILRVSAGLVHGAREVVRGMDRAPYFVDEPLPEAAQPQAQARGVQVRILYEGESLRAEGPRPEWADGVAPGEEARILPRLPMKLLVADRSAGLVARPLGPGRGDALLVHDSLLLDALVSVFDQLWDSAIPLDPGLNDPAQWEEVLAGELSRADRRLLALLGMGLTDEAIGRDQGVSARTVQRRLAVMQRALGVESRFQLGVQAARRGWI